LASEASIGPARSLAERIRQGDASAESELVHEFSRRIFVIALVRTGDREVAREFVQDTLLAVISALRKGQLHDPDKLASFVHGTARNLINNELRSRRQKPRLEPLPENLAQPSMIEELEQTERVRLVHRALEQLGNEDRRILWLTLVEGHKPAEIAAQLGVSSEVIRTRKLRAAKKVADFVRKKMSRT
jgi:RNA polymerase sigma-70 factor (ECF subfamily)